MTYTQLGSTFMPSLTWQTRIPVRRPISSESMLLWSGDRCWTTTKAMPVSVVGGMASKKASNAAKPPAEAPMPTMGTLRGTGWSSVTDSGLGSTSPTSPTSPSTFTPDSASGERELSGAFSGVLARSPPK